MDSRELPAILGTELDRLSEYLREVLKEHLGVPEQTQAFVRGGKQLRASLLFASAALYTPPPFGVDALRSAAGVELLHAASLVHDDIVDRCTERRGQPTRFHTSGARVAARDGMQLAQLALVLIADLPRAGRVRVAEVARSLSQGQLTEIVRAHDLGISPEERLLIMEQKTASVFGLVCELGGIVAEAPQSEWTYLKQLGTSFGMLFQIADDLADLWASSLELGRPPGADIHAGVVSLPIAIALRSKERNVVIQALDDATEGVSTLGKLRDLLRDAQALEQTYEIARGYASTALRHCAALPPAIAREWIEGLVACTLERVGRWIPRGALVDA
jgi:geranylgeranyl pyrophosphate synthase